MDPLDPSLIPAEQPVSQRDVAIPRVLGLRDVYEPTTAQGHQLASH
jgi:hypothetical protein